MPDGARRKNRALDWRRFAVALLPWLVLLGSPLRAEAEPVPFRVQVEDRAGRPVAHAELHALPSDETPTADAAAVSDERGRATLLLAPGVYRIRARAKSFLERTVGELRVPAAGESTLRIVLFPGGTLAGRVRDAGGQPVEAAEVCIELRDRESLPREILADAALEDGRACAASSATGEVQLPALPVGRYELRITAAGRVPLSTMLDLEPRLPVQEWRLRPGGGVAGRVEDADERAVAGARVVVRHRQREAAAETETDEQGGFRLEGLAPGAWNLRVEPPDGAVLERDGVAIEAGATVDLGRLRVRSGAVVAGTVRGPEGEPVGEAEVRAYAAEKPRKVLRRATTDAKGGFRLPGLGEQPLALLAVPRSGYAPRFVDDVTPPRRGLQIELEAPGRLCGSVRVRGGGSPPRGRIIARTADDGPLGRLLELKAATDEIDERTGEFCVEEVVPGDAVRVEGRFRGYASDSLTVAVAAGEDAGPVELLLERGLPLDGKVVDGPGNPVADATVRGGSTDAVFTDLLGEFRLEGLRPGMNTIVATHPDFAPAEREVPLPQEDWQRVVLQLGAGGTIEGSVRRTSGEPVDGVPVVLEEPPRQVFTDVDGRYRLPRVPPGPRTVSRGITQRYDDFENRRVEVVEGETITVDFVLGAVVEGQVSRGGIPLAHATIVAAQPQDPQAFTSGNHSVQRTVSDDGGFYRLAGARPGWGTVTVEHGRQLVERPVEIPAGDDVRIDLRLPAHLVRGAVLAEADDRPVAGAQVSAGLSAVAGAPSASGSSFYSRSTVGGDSVRFSLTTRHQAKTWTAADGRFELFVEGTGDESVTATAPGYRSATAAVDPADPTPLALRMARELRVALRLQDAAGRPVARSEVCFVSLGPDSDSRVCSFGGGDRVEQSLYEGRSYTVLAAAPGFGTTVLEDRTFEANPDGSPVEVPVLLTPGAPLEIRLVGQPPAGARVAALVDAAGRDRSILVRGRDADPATGDARWTTWPLTTGTWRVVVDPGDGTAIEKEIEVVPGPELVVVFP